MILLIALKQNSISFLHVHHVHLQMITSCNIISKPPVCSLGTIYEADWYTNCWYQSNEHVHHGRIHLVTRFLIHSPKELDKYMSLVLPYKDNLSSHQDCLSKQYGITHVEKSRGPKTCGTVSLVRSHPFSTQVTYQYQQSAMYITKTQIPVIKSKPYPEDIDSMARPNL